MFDFDGDPNWWFPLLKGWSVFLSIGAVGLGVLMLMGAMSGYPEELAVAGWIVGPLLGIGGAAYVVAWWNAPPE